MQKVRRFIRAMMKMLFSDVRLENFRNIEKAEIEFDCGLNVVFGKNAQGKTNLLEALSFIPALRSFRAAKERDLIKLDCQTSKICASYICRGRRREAEIVLSEGKKRRITIDGARVKTAAEFVGSINCVLFSPDNLYMIKGDPMQRRRFLDLAISQQKPAYLSALSEYSRLLDECSFLIKNWDEQPEKAKNTVQSWFYMLAEKGGYISFVREKYVSLLSGYMKRSYSDMSGGEEISCTYVTSCGEGSASDRMRTLYEKLNDGLSKQIAAKTLLYGVQRDDLNFSVDGKALRQFGSQGQQRSAVLSAKLSEGEIIKQTVGEYPVFLFDDVLSELDRDRKNYLLKRLIGKQIMITCCDDREFSDCGGKFIRAENGSFSDVRTE